MMLTSKPAAMKQGSLRSTRRCPFTPFTPFTSTRRLFVRSQKQDDTAAETGRRDVLSLLGLLAGLSAAQSAQAADPYEEMRALSAARAGLQPSASLLESFEGTKAAVSGSKTSRGIREKLAAEAAPAKSSGFSFGGSSSPKPKPASPVASAPKLFSAPSPKPAAPKATPATPKPAATAAAGGGSSGGASLASGPLVQAAGVLGLVGLGASVATSAATSKPKSKPAAASGSAAPSRAATPAPSGGTGKVQTAPSRSSTGKVLAGSAAAAAKSSTGKVSVSRPGTPASRPARSSTPSLKSATGKVKAGAAAAAASGSTVKTVVKQALVNEEAPDQPTDFATGGFLGFVALLGGFLLFGLPQPKVVTPTSSAPVDPLVEQAKQAAVKTSSSYSTPLFKSTDEKAPERKAIAVAPAAPALKAEAPKAPVLPIVPPKPAAVEAPKPAAVEAPAAVKAEAPKPAAVEAPKPAAPAVVEAPKPAAPVFKAVETPKVIEAPKPVAPKAAAPAPAPAAAPATAGEETQSPSAAQNLLVVAGGIAVVVTAFALTGSGSDSSSGAEGAAGAATGTPAAAGASGDSAAAATAAVVTAAESVSAAAPSTPTEGAQQGNAAYDQAVMALMADPEVTEDLFSVMSPGDASLRNIPALAWSLISTPSNAERLDGFAFQKLSKQRYERVRQVLLDAGLQLPDSPKVQPGAAATLAPAGDVDSSEVDPEKLRGVFEALLANPASRTLMRQLLKGAGMPFNEEAFEEQVKDSNYFNLAIAPILRSMPQQKLRVLAELQDPDKLNQLVSSVSTLAQDDQQLQAVTAELSSDVKQTVNTIREAEQRAASGTPSSS